jgi:two-component system, chemotaxis family, response regulator Rcp1
MKIVHVEDNAADADLLKEAFESIGISVQIRLFQDAREALKALELEQPDNDSSTPDIIVLDLNLPKMDGRELLKRLKENAQLKRIPVIILSTSSLDQDIAYCYENYANSYIVKPQRFVDYKRVAASVNEYWSSTVVLPQSVFRGY